MSGIKVKPNGIGILEIWNPLFVTFWSELVFLIHFLHLSRSQHAAPSSDFLPTWRGNCESFIPIEPRVKNVKVCVSCVLRKRWYFRKWNVSDFSQNWWNDSPINWARSLCYWSNRSRVTGVWSCPQVSSLTYVRAYVTDLTDYKRILPRWWEYNRESFYPLWKQSEKFEFWSSDFPDNLLRNAQIVNFDRPYLENLRFDCDETFKCVLVGSGVFPLRVDKNERNWMCFVCEPEWQNARFVRMFSPNKSLDVIPAM